MTTLLLAGLLTLAPLCATCGSDVHPATIQAIIEVESGGNPLAILDNATGKSYKPKDRTQAIRIAADLLAQGHSLDMGLMQINSQHLKKRKIDYRQLFDPCINIRAGTKILAEFYSIHTRNHPQDPPDLILLKSLSSYNTGTPYRGSKYVSKILRKAKYADNQYRMPSHRQFGKPPAMKSMYNMAFFRKETSY